MSSSLPTVSAAYEILEAEGLIAGHAGRGSFVTGKSAVGEAGVDWNALLERSAHLVKVLLTL